MYYDEYGNKENPTIVFLHGALATDSFCHQYCFQDKYHIIVPHIYGSGREVNEIYEPNKTIEAIASIIRSLNKDKVTVIGHSVGGELAVALVSKYPELFDKAVFLSAWVCSSEKSAKFYQKAAKVSCFNLKMSWLIRLQARYWKYNKEQENFMVEYSKKVTPEGYVAYFKNRIHLDDLPNYQNVNIPMLAICGDKELKEMKYSLSELGRRNPNCKTITLKNASHDFPMRFPDTLNPILLEFLQTKAAL